MTQQPPGWDPYGQPQGGGQPYGADPYGGQPSSPYGQSPPYGQPSSYGEVVPYQQAGYQAPAYQPYGPTWAAGPPRKTNGLAIASMVVALGGLVLCYFAFIAEIVALILGLVAKKRIRENDQDGGGMATAGIVISCVILGLAAITIIGEIVIYGSLIGFGGLAGTQNP